MTLDPMHRIFATQHRARSVEVVLVGVGGGVDENESSLLDVLRLATSHDFPLLTYRFCQNGRRPTKTLVRTRRADSPEPCSDRPATQ